MRESKKAKKARTLKIISKLKKQFPDADCSLSYESPLQLLISTILSAQCTDERVNMVTPELFDAFPTAYDYAKADRNEIEEIIHSTGFYRNKAKSIQGCCKSLVNQYNGEVPASMEELIKLAGVGRKTANVVLGNAFGIAEGVVVDTHVGRISNRLSLTSEQNPVRIEKDLIGLVPQKDWNVFSHLVIRHGRATCKARSPDCMECQLANLCPSEGKI